MPLLSRDIDKSKYDVRSLSNVELRMYIKSKVKVSNIKQQYDSWVVYAVKVGGVCGFIYS